jgi:hypothetical protein
MEGIPMVTWDFDNEQANFLDVMDLATESGPQLVKRGAQRVYVVSMEDWERMRGDHAGPVRSPMPQTMLQAARSPVSSRIDAP